jgi:hypothetical protein
MAGARSLRQEKVAYWYFHRSGFLQIENFVVHPRSRGGQCTDADLLAVRYPNRADHLINSAAAPAGECRPGSVTADRLQGLFQVSVGAGVGSQLLAQACACCRASRCQSWSM